MTHNTGALYIPPFEIDGRAIILEYRIRLTMQRRAKGQKR